MSVTPSPANVRSCAVALAVASSAIASAVLGTPAMGRGLARLGCTSKMHVRRKRRVNHAISTSMRRVVAVVESANECGDGGDAMGLVSRL
jgi:hypothetical protein